MKKYIINCLSATVILVGLSACDESTWENSPEVSGLGSLELSSLDIEVNNSEKVISRASVDINEFIVTIVDKNKETIVKQGIYGELPEIITLPMGDNYEVTVESHKVQKAEWDKPYFKGSKEFKIESGKITKIGEVTAKFSSLKITIKFTDELKSDLDSEASVTVYGSNGAQLVYRIDETRAGFFAIEGSTTFAAHFNGKIGGVSTTSETAFQNVAAGQHHILTYNVKGSADIPEQSGGVDTPDIQLDVDYKTEDVDGNTDVEEGLLDSSDRPGQEDSQDPENPGEENPTPDNPETEDVKFIYPADSWLQHGIIKKAANFDSDNDKAYVVIECPNKIKEFWVNIISDDPSFKESLEDEFNLKTNFDLADTSEENKELLETFGGMGFPTGNEVRGQTKVTFDISKFVGLLTIFNGKQTFTLTVTDEMGNTSSDTINIIGNEE